MASITAKKLEIEEKGCRVAQTEKWLRELAWRNWNLKEEKKELEKELKKLMEKRRRNRRKLNHFYHRLMTNYNIHGMINYNIRDSPRNAQRYWRPHFQVPRTPPLGDGSEDAFAHVKEYPELEGAQPGDAVNYDTKYDDPKGKCNATNLSVSGGGGGGGGGGKGDPAPKRTGQAPPPYSPLAMTVKAPDIQVQPPDIQEAGQEVGKSVKAKKAERKLRRLQKKQQKAQAAGGQYFGRQIGDANSQIRRTSSFCILCHLGASG